MFDSIGQPPSSTHDPAPLTLWLFGIAALPFLAVGLLAGGIEPAGPSWPGPALIVLGVYFIMCSTWAQDFWLYRLKAARAVDWYGPTRAHAAYRFLGFAQLTLGILFCWGSLP